MTESCKEIWKDAADYAGRYQVSNFGRVKSFPNKVRKTEIILKQQPSRKKLKCGKVIALIVSLTDALDGKYRQRRFYVHHLVIRAFKGERKSGFEVRHIDGDARNNREENLEYGTHMENMKDKLLHGTHNIGEKNPRLVLSKSQALEIKSRLLLRSRGDIAKVSKGLGINYSTVRSIANGSNWSHL